MKRTLIIHGCWAVAAIAAFSLGSRTAGPLSKDQSTPIGRLGDFRSSTVVGESGSDGRTSRSGGRALEDRAASDLEKVFGSIASASKNLDLLAEQALRDPSPITRRLAFSLLLEALTPENAGEIRSKLVALGADGDQWRDFHYSWGAISGKAAFDHAATSDEPDLAATMTGWAAANPGEALTMLDKLPPE
ncbi:MAG: hypothetical protein RLZZ214_1650, partial [Verrucomicrobiota bacterium]